LANIRIYVIDPANSSKPGYWGGNGGSMQVSVQTDNGGVPSGTVLASTNFANVGSWPIFPVIGFSPAPNLTAGVLYHIVFRNTDPSPLVNFISIDGTWVATPILTPRQAKYPDSDWGQLMNTGSGWQIRPEYTPIMALTYANGASEGMGYMEVWVGQAKTISGVAQAREAFTVSGGTRTISTLSVRLQRIAGSSPLTVRLERSDGSLVAQGSIAAAAFPSAIPGWATANFGSAVTLANGSSYNLVLSSPSDSAYSIFVIRKGVEYSFPTTTYFADGHAQYNSGTGWVAFDPGWRGPLDEGDLQLYFR
jgi:hypothetical protein